MVHLSMTNLYVFATLFTILAILPSGLPSTECTSPHGCPTFVPRPSRTPHRYVTRTATMSATATSTASSSATSTASSTSTPSANITNSSSSSSTPSPSPSRNASSSCTSFVPPFPTLLRGFYPMCNPSNPGQDYSFNQQNSIPYNNVTVIPSIGAIFATDQFLQLPPNNSLNYNSFTLAFQYTHMTQFDNIGNDWSINFISNDYGYNLFEWSSFDTTLGIYTLSTFHTPFVPTLTLPLNDTSTHTFILIGNNTMFTLYMDTVSTSGSVSSFDLSTHTAQTIGNDYFVGHIQPCRGAMKNFVLYNAYISPVVLFAAYNTSTLPPNVSSSPSPTPSRQPSSSPSSTPYPPVPPSDGPFVIDDYANWEPLALAGSDQQFCYIDSCGTIQCPVTVPTCGLPLVNTSFIALYGSYGDNCEYFGLQSSNLVYGWGYNGENRITGINTSVPYRSMSIGGHCTFALQEDHTLAVAGYNAWGQCVNPGGVYSRISAQYVSTCALTRLTNVVVCWGESHGLIPGRQKLISRGDKVYCTLDNNGTVQCTGWYSLPTVGVPPLRYVTVNSGPTACGLLGNFTIYCWGKPLIDGPPTGQYVYITTSGGIFCAVSIRGTVACWNGVYPSLQYAIQNITVLLPSHGTVLNQLFPNITNVCNQTMMYESSGKDVPDSNGDGSRLSASSMTMIMGIVGGISFVIVFLQVLYRRYRRFHQHHAAPSLPMTSAYTPLNDHSNES